jgi:hypothetical protein
MIATEAPEFAGTPASESPRTQVTVDNWDKGGALSHWVYTHVSEVFPFGGGSRREAVDRSGPGWLLR